MSLSKKLLIVLLLGVVLTQGVFAVLADDRINVVHHFGGDVLFCNTVDGCELLNMHGESLWTVAQSAIDAALTAACTSRETQIIEAGEGTYGPFTLEISCFEGIPAFLNLTGYDEWGKLNSMKFEPTYAPVNPAPSQDEAVAATAGNCVVDLAFYHFLSIDGIHNSVGYDIWSSNAEHALIKFLFWTASRPTLPDCDFGAGS